MSLENQREMRLLTTEQLANALQMNPQSLRKRLSQTGTYFGVRPIKLPNGKLRWPSDSLARLIAPAESSSNARGGA